MNNLPYPLYRAGATDNRTTKHLNIVLKNNELPAFSIVGTQAGSYGERQVSLPNSNQRIKTAQGTKKPSKIKSLGQTALTNALERNSLSESESQKNQLQTVQVTKPGFVRNSEDNFIGTTQKTFSE